MSKFLGILILTLGATSAANAFSTVPRWVHAQEVSAPPSQTTPTAAPEIDPASAISAFALLAGGLAVIRGSRVSQKRS